MHLFHLIKRMSAAAVTCIVSTVILCGNFLSAQAYTFTPDKTLHSQAAILYNRDTEQVLYEKNPGSAPDAGTPGADHDGDRGHAELFRPGWHDHYGR